jgi:hypothetical protein
MIIDRPLGGLLIVRSDSWGDGNFGSPRGQTSDGATKPHDGLDLTVEPGEPIFSMIDGVVEKIDHPYASDLNWTGIQIGNGEIRTEIWYMVPTVQQGFVERGEQIGVAQDISQKYGFHEERGFMTPHIHVRVTLMAFTVLANGRYVSYEQHVDPLLFIGE